MPRQTIGLAIIVLLLSALGGLALAADPPGGPGWYQAIDGFNVSVPTKGFLIIAPDTPGQLVGTTGNLLTIRFERGIALWLGREITNDPLLTINVSPTSVRAFVKQPLSKQDDGTTKVTRGGAEPGALGALAGTTTGAGVGGRSNVGVGRETTLVVDDTVNVVRRETPAAGPIADGRGSGPQVFPPSGSGAGGGTGGTTRVISREEHDARLAKVLALWEEDGARCETKGYGPGWVSVCESKAA